MQAAGLPLPFEGCSSLYNFSFLHTPRPCRRACRGFSSPFLGRHRSPRVHGPVYTPQDWPSSSAHVRQQPQPGSFTTGQPTGTGGHMERAFWSQGSHGTYDAPQLVTHSKGSTKRDTLSSIVRGMIYQLENPMWTKDCAPQVRKAVTVDDQYRN